MISKIVLQNFKNVSKFETELESINVLIGANNSGKSSVLQGIHFTIMAEVMRKKIQKTVVPEDSLIYNPSSNYLCLRHNEQYTVSTGNESCLILFSSEHSIEKTDNLTIHISKGRNEKNISVSTFSQYYTVFRQLVTAWTPLYSMYVPGISGIPINEKLISKAELRKAVAQGDANMYIRNIIYRIKKDDKLNYLNDKLHEFFPYITIEVPYNEEEDLHVIVNIKIKNNNNQVVVPLEQCGTGALQVLQILSYAIYFSPKLLLLDEPDEHLHPNNQKILSQVLKDMAEENNIQIILCTHSRHLLAELNSYAKIIWMSNGNAKEYDYTKNYHDLLMDIGAFDSFDECLNGQFDYVFLTEDTNPQMLEVIVKQSGFKSFYIFSYNGCGKLDTALLLAKFIHDSAPNCKIIIHRDRDFMMDYEIEYVEKQIKSSDAEAFITKGSDIEAYFVDPKHLAAIFGENVCDIEEWISELIESNKSDIHVDFTNKRNELTNKLSSYYYNDKHKKPDVKKLINEFESKNSVYESLKIVKGKFMMKKINGSKFEKFKKDAKIVSPTEYLDIPELRQLLKESKVELPV